MPSIEEIDPDAQAGPSQSNNATQTSTSTTLVRVGSKIEEIRPNKYSGLSTLAEQLDEKNWAAWSKRIISILKSAKSIHTYKARSPNRTKP